MIQINSACLIGNISLFNCTSSQNSIQCCKRKTLSLDPKDCLYCKQIWIQLFLLAEEVLLGNGEGSRGHRRRFITVGREKILWTESDSLVENHFLPIKYHLRREVQDASTASCLTSSGAAT